MPEYIRALVVILVLASIVFFFAKAPATAIAIAPEDFVRRRNTWIYITLAGFLSQNYWVFVVVVSLLIYNAAKKESNKIALFFFLVLALPQIRVEIPGFAGIRYLYEIDYLKILTLLVLLPVCLQARKLAALNRSKSYLPDKLLATYIVLNLILQARSDIATNVLRSALSWGIDVVIPYYAISRNIKDIKGFKDVLMSFVVAAMLSSIIGIFEFARHWILYPSSGDALGVRFSAGYLARDDFLRASATSGHPIVLGYVITISIGFMLYLRQSIPNIRIYAACLALLIAGVISPLSRGPWVGLIAILFIYLVTGEQALQRFIKLAFASLPFLIVLLMTPYGQKVINYLPFVGTVENENVTYRANLFDISLQIILDNPFFGSTDYLLHMEELRQGQGIIDLVNTFLIVGLNTGLIGLSLYLLFFATICIAVVRRMRRIPFDDEIHFMGQSLLATLLGALLIIATVSPIYHVPLLLWSLAAMALRYATLVQLPTPLIDKVSSISGHSHNLNSNVNS